MHLENNFKRSFPNDNLLHFLQKARTYGGVVCGGFARWMSGLGPDSKPHDVDIYVPDKESESKILNSLGKYELLLDESFENIYIDAKIECIHTLNNEDSVSRFGFPIQIIRMPFEFPEEILDTFDFPVCKAYIHLKDWTCRYTIDFFSDISECKLRYTKKIEEEYANNILRRISKYLLKGFKMDLKEFYRIKNSFNQISTRDFFIHHFVSMYKYPLFNEFENSPIDNLTEVLDIDKIDLIETIGNS